MNYKQSATELAKYILDNREKTIIQTMKYKEEARMKKAMDIIRRIMAQMNMCNRETDMEEQILRYQCYLATHALEINKQVGDWKMLREIMGTVERTYMESEEYLLLKTEILLDANERKEATLVYNTLEKRKVICRTS
jgi:hypothetical protein